MSVARRSIATSEARKLKSISMVYKTRPWRVFFAFCDLSTVTL